MKNSKTILVISTFLLLFSNSYSDTIKEIKLLEDYSREILGETSKTKLEVKKVEKLKKRKDIPVDEKEKKNVPIDAIVDLYEKTSKNDIVFKKDETTPFTGFFGIVLNGNIEYYEEYKNGLLNGETAWFSRKSNVKLLSEIYSNGKLVGEQKTFYENGNLKSIVYYENNKINGLKTYDINSKIIHESLFKKGTGIWKFFWSNGNILEEGKYSSWRKNGVWKRYRKDGSLEKTTVYNKGRMTSQRWE